MPRSQGAAGDSARVTAPSFLDLLWVAPATVSPRCCHPWGVVPTGCPGCPQARWVQGAGDKLQGGFCSSLCPWGVAGDTTRLCPPVRVGALSPDVWRVRGRRVPHHRHPQHRTRVPRGAAAAPTPQLPSALPRARNPHFPPNLGAPGAAGGSGVALPPRRCWEQSARVFVTESSL